jgi:hypothetical protein
MGIRLATGGTSTSGRTSARRRRCAAERQASEQKRRRPTGVNAHAQTGQAIVTGIVT